LSRPTATESLAFDAVREWAFAARRIAEEHAEAGIQATTKDGPFDLLTPADQAIERYLREEIRQRFPGHGFVGEEGGDEAGQDGWQWVVDPIDGTLNYATGLGGAASSIALVRDGDPVVGAIADFSSGFVYRSRSGLGGILRSDGSSEIDCRPMVSAAGSARLFVEWGWEGLDPVMVATIQALSAVRTRVLRIMGGAAYALLSVALHGGSFLGVGLRMWDVAAGIVLAREAGREVRLRQETAAIHVLAGSEADIRELAPLIEHFGSKRVVAV
jgi:fructose-1,6-bisphosphatase/inositol monophosphatase family enzyme